MTAYPRTVSDIIEPILVREGAGVLLKRSMATQRLDYLDPFLLFDHFGSDNPRDYLAGFPMHPHRGIETVTYMLAGRVTHKDSLGNAGTIGAGDVQWMTSGRGIMHEEMPQPVAGKMGGFQLWVNLPAKLKMSQPRYQEIPSRLIPEVAEGGSVVRVIAGTVGEVRGPVTEIAADPTYLDVSVAARLVILSDGDYLEVRTGNAPVRFLLISGKPLHEPIARYGPFVMNTRLEIEQALRDLRNGTFVSS
jgi:redox-sensitive bicupin YhaK (pirin superfamily)